MISSHFVGTFAKWKAHPRRYDLPFLAADVIRRYIDLRRAEGRRRRLLVPPIDTANVEILDDPDFRASCVSAGSHTLLDVARLANLWCLARMAGSGTFLEVGTYKGGGALHICNAAAARGNFYCFDPFEEAGFECVHVLDELFHKEQFMNTRYEQVVELLKVHSNATVVKGFFPSAAYELELAPIAFCHLDVDVYRATTASLDFLKDRLAPRSLIVLDDLNRGVKGVQQAVSEFLDQNPAFVLLPMFPSQGVLFSTELW